MTQVLLAVRYRVTADPVAFRHSMEKPAAAIASVDGLRWKIWGLDTECGQGLSAYLFASKAAATRFADGPIIERLRGHPDVVDVSVALAPVDQQLSELTHASTALSHVPGLAV